MQKVVGAIRQQLVIQIDRYFVQREILIRAEGRVRYLTLTKKHQMAAAGLAAAFIVWATVSTVGGVIAGWLASERGAESERLAGELNRIEGQVINLQEKFAAVSRDLSTNQQYVLDLVHASQGGELPALAAAAPFVVDRTAGGPSVDAVIAAINSDLDRISSNNFVLSKEVSDAQLKISTAADAEVRTRLARDRYRIKLGQTQRQLAQAEAAHRQLKSQVADLQLRVGSLLTAQAAESTENAVLQGQLTRLDTALAETQASNARLQAMVTGMQRNSSAAAQDRIALRAVRDELLSKVQGLETRLNTVSSTQKTMVEKLTQRTRVGVDEIEKTVAMTGLQVNALLNAAGKQLSGEGGPFITPHSYARSAEDRLILASIENLDGEVERWERLQVVLRSLPLAAPLDSYALRSGFGVRKDPMSGRTGMHEGLDLANDVGTPVLATAPGKVVYAGWMGDYGRMIEIDHGLGIRTRYGHLKKIEVKVGDTVGYRDEIGLLGSSGRSTGPHLHYEVRVDNRPYDPINFLEAGKYVFKG
jgi:murein DD-endopeptidase MepM/ murein hydrolase activator NlpD